MKNPLDKIVRFFRKSSLMLGLLIAMGVVIVMTLVSVFLYAESGVSKLDLSRPGLEGVIEEVDKGRVEAENFSSSGPINAGVLEEFLTKYQKEGQSLEAAGDFEDGRISNEQLGLPKEQE